ncbi:MAG: hypothetical protein HY741_07440 [Chloroflexi bacterium]|nr:hypothetical protein [Chloroflexota bacterium]
MQISPLIPFVGLLLIVLNVVVAVVSPYRPPTLMGIQLFLGGMTTLLIAVIDLINPIGVSEFERVLLFGTGGLNCTIGYYMVLLESRRGV